MHFLANCSPRSISRRNTGCSVSWCALAQDSANRPNAATVPCAAVRETAMPSDCRHLTCEERCQIRALNRSGLPTAAITTQLGRSRSAVCRKIRRSDGSRSDHLGRNRQKAGGRRSVAHVPASPVQRNRHGPDSRRTGCRCSGGTSEDRLPFSHRSTQARQ